MRRKSHHTFQFDALEMRTLLAGNVPLLSSVPLGGIETPTSSADVVFMQQDASNNNLELMLAQTAMILGTRTDVQQYAALLLRDHRDAGFNLHFLADTRGAILPPGLMPTEQAMASQFLSSVGGSGTANFDQNYLNMMVQMHTQTIATFQSQLAAATDPAFKTFLQSQIPVLQSHLSLAQQLLAGPTTISPTTPPAAGPEQLSTSDVQVLTRIYSGSWLERYISEVASTLASGQSQGGSSQGQGATSQFMAFADKVVDDHATDMYRQELIAAGSNTPLPAGLQPNDVQIASQLLSTLTSSSSNLQPAAQSYLTTIIQTNQQDITQAQQDLTGVKDTSLKQVIQSSIPTDTLHINGAQTVLMSNMFPTPQGHHARAVVRAYQKLYGRTPTWAELYYYTNMIRAHPTSLAWYRQLSASQDGNIDFTNGTFGRYGGTGSGSGSTAASRAKSQHHVVAVAHPATGSGSGGPVVAATRAHAAGLRAQAIAAARAAKHHRS
jgi:putative membrane protein